MILSALLTSVGINVALCILFFILYSILRNQPRNNDLYIPRLVAEGKVEREEEFRVGRLLPSFEWVKKAWRPSEDDLLSYSGLDAVVFMRIFTFGLKVFLVAGIVGILILLPFNYAGNQLNIDFTGLPDKSLDSFSISNVDDGSNRLWIHFCAIYIFTAVVCYLLYVEFDYIASKRFAFFYSSKRQPGQFTVLVRSIPVTPERSFSESVESYFSEYYPSSYLSHSMVRGTGKLRGLVNKADKAYRKLVHLKSRNNEQQRYTRSGCLGLCGQRIDLDEYEKSLEDMEHNVMTERSAIAGKEVAAAFVSFKSRLTAATVVHVQQRLKPTEWVTEQAPDPQDVYWPFFSTSFFKKWLCNIVVIVAWICFTLLFVIPVVFVQGLANLDQLERWFPFLKGLLEIKVVSQVVTGYLPSLILVLLQSLVPPVMITLSSIQGYSAFSIIEKSACSKVLWFTIWNVFFANVLSGTALYNADIFLEPKNIPAILAVAVPGQASFFISYVVTSGWTKTFSGKLFRLNPLIWSYVKGILCCNSDEEHEVQVPSNPYHSEIPRILFFILLGITYFFLAPLILPFVLVYFCFGYIVYRNQLFNVYKPKFETGGTFWTVVHNATIFALILMHIIAIGIFGLKKVPVASSVTIPLPILTLIFNSYCRRRFLPSFRVYPAECLINKDRMDENDEGISSFFDELATAYQDPATKSRRESDSSNSPLLDRSNV